MCQKPERQRGHRAELTCHRFTQISADQRNTSGLLIGVNGVHLWLFLPVLPSLTVGLLTPFS